MNDTGTGITPRKVGAMLTLTGVLAFMGGAGVNSRVQGHHADGAAVTADPVVIGGKDGSGNAQDVLTDTSGRLDVTMGGGAGAVVGGGAEATAQRVTIANDSTGLLSVDDNGGSLTVDNAALAVVGSGVVTAATLRVELASDSAGVLSVDDNGGDLSVDWAGTAPPIGAGAEATALRVTVATDSTGVLSVDDNGGNLSVDLGGTAASLNAGVLDAGTQRVTIATDDEVNNLLGTIDADTGNIATDTDSLAVVGGGAEATAVRVTLANDSTGLVSVDDNGGNLSIDLGGTAASLNAGAADAGTQRVITASDSLDVTALELIDDAFVAEDGAAPARFATIAAIDSGNLVQPLQVNASEELLIAQDGIAVLGSDFVATAADQQAAAAAAGLQLLYLSFEETAGAVANIIVRHGTLETDEAIIHIRLAANESRSEFFPIPIDAADGVFLDRVSGTYSATVGTRTRND